MVLPSFLLNLVGVLRVLCSFLLTSSTVSGTGRDNLVRDTFAFNNSEFQVAGSFAPINLSSPGFGKKYQLSKRIFIVNFEQSFICTRH